MEDGTDPYGVLNVPSSASDEEIRKAYRSQARKYHPDKNRGKPNEEALLNLFNKLQQAYDLLTDAVSACFERKWGGERWKGRERKGLRE